MNIGKLQGYTPHNVDAKAPQEEQKYPNLNKIFQQLITSQTNYQSRAKQASQSLKNRKFTILTNKPPLNKEIAGPTKNIL